MIYVRILSKLFGNGILFGFSSAMALQLNESCRDWIQSGHNYLYSRTDVGMFNVAPKISKILVRTFSI